MSDVDDGYPRYVNRPWELRDGARVTIVRDPGHGSPLVGRRGTVIGEARDGRGTLYVRVAVDDDAFHSRSLRLDQIITAPSAATLEARIAILERRIVELGGELP